MRYFQFTEKVFRSLLSVFFKMLYNQFAWSYNLISNLVSIGLWKKWILSVIPYLQGIRVLELGFGPGHLQVRLSADKYTAVGIDKSSHMCQMTQKYLRKSGYESKLVMADAQYIPFPEKAFDHIISTFPSEYIFNLNTCQEMYRTLKPNGSAILLPLAWIKGIYFWEKFFEKLFRVTGQSSDWDDRLIKPFNTVGFKIDKQTTYIDHSMVLVLILTKYSENL